MLPFFLCRIRLLPLAMCACCNSPRDTTRVSVPHSKGPRRTSCKRWPSHRTPLVWPWPKATILCLYTRCAVSNRGWVCVGSGCWLVVKSVARWCA